MWDTDKITADYKLRHPTLTDAEIQARMKQNYFSNTAGTGAVTAKYDPDSIMHYPVLAGLLQTGYEHQARGWNRVLSSEDKQSALKLYPYPRHGLLVLCLLLTLIQHVLEFSSNATAAGMYRVGADLKRYFVFKTDTLGALCFSDLAARTITSGEFKKVVEGERDEPESVGRMLDIDLPSLRQAALLLRFPAKRSKNWSV